MSWPPSTRPERTRPRSLSETTRGRTAPPIPLEPSLDRRASIRHLAYGLFAPLAYPPRVKARTLFLLTMALEGPAKYFAYEKSRRMIYISKEVASDSQFPFKPGDSLLVRIDASQKRIIIEKAK